MTLAVEHGCESDDGGCGRWTASVLGRVRKRNLGGQQFWEGGPGQSGPDSRTDVPTTTLPLLEVTSYNAVRAYLARHSRGKCHAVNNFL